MVIIDNKIERTFKGPLTFMAIAFLIVSLVFVLSGKWYVAIPVFIIALFFLFTWSGVVIDTENRQFKPYYMVFGLFKRGQWLSLEKHVGLTLVPMQKVYAMRSQSNRKSKSVSSDFRIYLVDRNKRPTFALKSCKNAENGKISIDEFSIWLRMPIYSVKQAK